MKKGLLLVFLFLGVLVSSKAQYKVYRDLANERADKIVSKLKLGDSQKNKVKELIASQFVGLHEIHTKRDQQIEGNPTQKDALKVVADKEVAKLHVTYLAKLNKELTAAQIEEVKNGMTFHTAPLTYANYLLMLPYLSKDNKEKIWTILVEGREHAMDGGTSDEKHAWFNKYKGKIANMLSQQGYQLKEEGIDWAKRRDLKSTDLAIVESNRVIAVLNLSDSVKKESVRNLIAHQYQQITKIHTAKQARMDNASKLAKEQGDKEKQAAWEDSMAKLNKQRDLFNAMLLDFVDEKQAESIRNEMTGQGLKHEYEKFQALLPNMTIEQKKKVYDYLVEARDNAMNVLTSRERNQWFAKFRGRANNYLSAQGYNLRKATEDLERKTQGEKP